MSHHMSSLLTPQPTPQCVAPFPDPPEQPHPDEAHPQHAGPFSRLAIQSPLIGYESNSIAEINSTEVTSVNPESRRTSFCSANKSGEEVATVPMSSEVDDGQCRQLASPLQMQKREASAIFAGHTRGESSTSHSPHSSTGRSVAPHSHKRKSSRDMRKSQERQLANERIRAGQEPCKRSRASRT